jgi:hypothetical protein
MSFDLGVLPGESFEQPVRDPPNMGFTKRDAHVTGINLGST